MKIKSAWKWMVGVLVILAVIFGVSWHKLSQKDNAQSINNEAETMQAQ